VRSIMAFLNVNYFHTAFHPFYLVMSGRYVIICQIQAYICHSRLPQ